MGYLKKIEMIIPTALIVGIKSYLIHKLAYFTINGEINLVFEMK